jgi:diguanylate cyclase (GGDEF)-like protein/PAS domain S-box-containing protein
MSHPYPSNETTRLAALDALEVLDTVGEERFDRFTRLATLTFRVPTALVSLVDADRQWFKSRCGLDVSETPRSIAFCSHAVAQHDIFVVEDASLDPRFAANPLVVGPPHIRFYAGQPVYSDGQAVGTLCIIDYVPRTLNENERRALRDLADLVEIELNHAKVQTARVMAEQALKALNAELEHRIARRTEELQGKVAELSNEMTRRNLAEGSLRESEAWNRTIVASSYSGFVGANEDGNIIEWNPSAERIFGWTQAQALGRSLSELIVPQHMRTAHEDGMRRFAKTGTGPVIDRKVELPALTASGRQITVEMTISAYEWHGKRCFGAFMNDISERIRIQQQLEEKQELLDAVLESIDVAVVACDAVGNLSLFNRTARAVHGMDLKAIVPSEWSRHYSLYHGDGKTPLAMDEIPLVRALKGDTVRDQTIVIAPQDKPSRTLLASGRLLRSATGRPLGAVAVMKDITELNASRAQLAVNERRLRAITENLPALIGKVNVAGKFVFLNGHALQAYGKTAGELLGQDVAQAYSPAAYARIAPYIKRVVAGERVFFEYVVRNGQRELHYQCSFIPQRLPNGQPDGFFAMANDITSRKLSELQLVDSEERLRTITDNVPVLIAQLDSEHRYRFANAVHASWLGKSADKILGQTMEEAFGREHYSQQVAALEQAWRGQASQCEHEIVRKKHTRIVHSTFLPQLREGFVTSVFVLTTDATASRQHERNLHALAHTDALTALPNRRHFDAALQTCVSRRPQTGQHLALLYLDIDYFKQINDKHGHATGDAVLVEFARRLRAAVRTSDIVARLAGDEFTVLLQDVRSEADVELVMRKILEAIWTPFVLPDCTLNVATTIGAAIAAGPGMTPRLLMESADAALYTAKNAGRNTYAIRNLCHAAQTPLKLAHA